MENTLNIFEASATLRWSLRLFGIGCFTIPPKAGDPHVTIFDAAICLLNVALSSYLSYITHFGSFFTRNVLTVGLELMYSSDYFVMIAMMLSTLCQYKRIARLLFSLQRVDEQLDASGINVPHDRHRRVMRCFVIGIAVHNTGMTLMTAASYHLVCGIGWLQTIYLFFNHGYTITCHSMVITVYYFGLLAVQQRVQLLNNGLARIADIDAIRRFRRVHVQLAVIADECNWCFAGPVTAAFAITFGYVLFLLFTIHKVLEAGINLDRAVFLLVLILWNWLFFVLLMAICHVGGRLVTCGQQTGVLAHATENQLDAFADRLKMLELQLFGRQVLHRWPVASCGLFTFDWTFMFSVWTLNCSHAIWIVIMFVFSRLLQPVRHTR